MLGKPTEEYFIWAKAGWADPRAVRYPMGKGAKPLFSWWRGQNLSYVEARKRVYAPLYGEAVQKTKGWERLARLYRSPGLMVLRDYDGYDHVAINRTLSDVLNDPNRKMGHAFVLAMLLTNDPALRETDLKVEV